MCIRDSYYNFKVKTEDDEAFEPADPSKRIYFNDDERDKTKEKLNTRFEIHYKGSAKEEKNDDEDASTMTYEPAFIEFKSPAEHRVGSKVVDGKIVENERPYDIEMQIAHKVLDKDEHGEDDPEVAIMSIFFEIKKEDEETVNCEEKAALANQDDAA